MRIREGESYEDWCERVRTFELDHARRRIAKGEDTDLVLAEMSGKIMKKLLHPVMTRLRHQPDTNMEDSRRSYEEKYLKHNAPKADQVDGNLFDKTD